MSEKTLDDLKPNTKIKVYWKEGETIRPNPQEFMFLGIQMCKNPKEEKNGLTQDFIIIAKPLSGDVMFKEGEGIIPEALFAGLIDHIEVED